jgi:hypothetical protein
MLVCRVQRYQRHASFVVSASTILVLLLSPSCGANIYKAGAKAVSDSFMADLVANRLDDALLW